MEILEQETNSKPHLYGESVYYQIILNDAFLENIVNVNPYLFALIIQELNKDEVKDTYFVNKFLKILMLNKNSDFFREIKNNQNLDQHNSYLIEKSRPILYALFKDVHVCEVNEAWRGIGEQAIQEMQEEAKKEFSLLRESDREQDSDTLWSFRITNAIWYFDIMIREAIVQDSKSHMYLFYYHYFISAILDNMENIPYEGSEQNRDSRNFDLVYHICSNMMDWKKTIVSSANMELAKSIYSCLGLCIYKLSTTQKLRKEDKNELIGSIWIDLIESYGEDENQQLITEEIIDLGFKMFKKPIEAFHLDPSTEEYDKKDKLYVNAITELWNKRDIPKISGGIFEIRANRFKTEVLDELLAY